MYTRVTFCVLIALFVLSALIISPSLASYPHGGVLTTRLSVSSNGVGGNAPSHSPAITADGRFVAFYTEANNLEAHDTNSQGDIYLSDTTANTTTRVSITDLPLPPPNGSNGGRASADGRYIVFAARDNAIVGLPPVQNGAQNVFLYDTQADSFTLLSTAISGNPNQHSYSPAISAEGTVIAFYSNASNLVPDDTNNRPDLFVYDRTTGVLSRGPAGDGDAWENVATTPAPDLSTDGRYITMVSIYALVAEDTNNRRDVYRFDRSNNTVVLVSVADDESIATFPMGDGIEKSAGAALSGNGRYVIFSSSANNLVPNDSNNVPDVFVRDITAGTTTRISVSPAGVEGNHRSGGVHPNGFSFSPNDISEDGRIVTFAALADNLVAKDTNAKWDVFVRDLDTNTTERVSVGAEGAEANGDSGNDTIALSDDGQRVLFESRAGNLTAEPSTAGLFVHNRTTHTTSAILRYTDGGPSGGESLFPDIIGNTEAYLYAHRLDRVIPGDSNSTMDVVWDTRTTGESHIRTVAHVGYQLQYRADGPALSANGRYLVYSTGAENVVANPLISDLDKVIRRDLQTGANTLVSVTANGNNSNGYSSGGSISPDGRYIAFISSSSNLVPNDTNNTRDVFLRDMVNGTTQRVSISTTGQQQQAQPVTNNPSLSSDGRFVVFSSTSRLAPNDQNSVTDVYIRDVLSQTTEVISVGLDGIAANNTSLQGVISPDGRYVAFASRATNLVTGDTNTICDLNTYPPLFNCSDVFLRDRVLGTTIRLSVNAEGVESNGSSFEPTFSGDGRYIAFTTNAGNLVSDDTNNVCDYPNDPTRTINCYDILLYTLATGTLERVSLATNGTEGNGNSMMATVNINGDFVAFASDASNFAANDGNGDSDVFLRIRNLPPTPTPTATPSRTATAPPTTLPSATATNTPAPTLPPSASATAIVTSSSTPTPGDGAPAATTTPSPTLTATATVPPTATPTAGVTPTLPSERHLYLPVVQR